MLCDILDLQNLPISRQEFWVTERLHIHRTVDCCVLIVRTAGPWLSGSQGPEGNRAMNFLFKTYPTPSDYEAVEKEVLKHPHTASSSSICYHRFTSSSLKVPQNICPLGWLIPQRGYPTLHLKGDHHFQKRSETHSKCTSMYSRAPHPALACSLILPSYPIYEILTVC
jgi:hypothetical protein